MPAAIPSPARFNRPPWLEVGVFVAAGVLMGLIGPDALGANQIVLNVTTITYMVPMGRSALATGPSGFYLVSRRKPGADNGVSISDRA
jgi:Na+-driven multidrug efflux pump